MKGRSTKGAYLVLCECTDPSVEEEFNDWYTNTHLHDIVGTGLFTRALRYEAANACGELEEEEAALAAGHRRLLDERQGSEVAGRLEDLFAEGGVMVRP